MTDEIAAKSPGLIYRLLSLLLFPFWYLHGLRHGSKYSMPDYWTLRLGKTNDSSDQHPVWVHASSVGEVQAVTPLVESLFERDEAILFTCFTATGLRTIEQNFSDRVDRRIIPVDFYRTCRRFFQAHNLKLGLIMETELWPEMLYQARLHNVPLVLINARVSQKTIGANKFLRQLAANTLGNFAQILTRSDNDKTLLLKLGADQERIRIIGNLKTPQVDDAPKPRLVERDYILLASSHPGEERLFIESRPSGFDSTLLVIAPRHPRRSEKLQHEFSQLGLNYAVRSKAQNPVESTEVYLADTLGEMKSLMSHARLVVMGGSFNQVGGHNLLEPASLGCAIITGPSDNNIRADIKMLDDGVIQVGDMAQCWRRINELLTDGDRAQSLGAAARNRLTQQPDMVSKYMEEIETWL